MLYKSSKLRCPPLCGLIIRKLYVTYAKAPCGSPSVLDTEESFKLLLQDILLHLLDSSSSTNLDFDGIPHLFCIPVILWNLAR
ncbi:hypothetical protein Tco_1183223 [Tanacetum coccineum]